MFLFFFNLSERKLYFRKGGKINDEYLACTDVFDNNNKKKQFGKVTVFTQNLTKEKTGKNRPSSQADSSNPGLF